MQDIYAAIEGFTSTGEAAALATVVAVKGSTPRAEGSKMLVCRDGSVLGSIGGGCIEAAVWQAAKKTLATRAPQLLDYDLTGREDTPEGLICGGTMRVFLERVPPDSPTEIFKTLILAKEAGEASALATVIAATDGLRPGAKMLIREDGQTLGSLGNEQLDASARHAAIQAMRHQVPELLSAGHPGTAQVFVEPVFPVPSVYIFGAGHIGYAVSKIAALTGFRVMVIDDRPAYANKERFPDAEEFFVEDPAGAVPGLQLNKAAYAVIACRGHLEDQRVLREVLQTNAGYIGMIGSRKKSKTVFANLVNDGVSMDVLKRVHAPIGLPIATETPEEIAVSIMAEIINARRAGRKSNRDAAAG